MDNKVKQKTKKTGKNIQEFDIMESKNGDINVDDELLMNLTSDLLDKQYRLYSWADSKTASLIQTNSILLATIGFIFKDSLNDILATFFIFFAIIANVVSLFFCLRQVKPQRSSGKGVAKEPNIRALSGILKIETWQEYHNKLISTNKKQLYEFSARQIFGMARNIEDSRNNTTKAMKITLFGIAFLILSFFSVSLTSNDIHLLGKWQKFNTNEIPLKIEDTLKKSANQWIFW